MHQIHSQKQKRRKTEVGDRCCSRRRCLEGQFRWREEKAQTARKRKKKKNEEEQSVIVKEKDHDLKCHHYRDHFSFECQKGILMLDLVLVFC